MNRTDRLYALVGADVNATEQLSARALAADPADPLLAGFCRASVGMALFTAGDTAAALGPFAEGTAALSRLPKRRADIDPGAVAADPGRAR